MLYLIAAIRYARRIIGRDIAHIVRYSDTALGWTQLIWGGPAVVKHAFVGYGNDLSGKVLDDSGVSFESVARLAKLGHGEVRNWGGNRFHASDQPRSAAGRSVFIGEDCVVFSYARTG
jgi:hypothetical protein